MTQPPMYGYHSQPPLRPGAVAPLGGPGTPPHLVGCVPISLGKRILLTIINDLGAGVVAGLLAVVLHVLGVSGDSDSPASLVGLAFLVIYAVTGYTMPFGALLRVRQVKVNEAKVPGWAGIGKYLLEYVFQIPLLIPYLIVVFGTRNQIQRHWIDRLCGIIVLDTGRGRDPLGKA